jgi:hypothetical protein
MPALEGGPAQPGESNGRSSSATAQRRLQHSLYDILQVSPLVEQPVLTAAYRTLARAYHPDLNQDPRAAGEMRRLNEAYETLSDPQRRAHYDVTIGRQRSELELSLERDTVRRRTACWNCGELLLGAYARYCADCHWLKCEACHACGCNHPTWKRERVVVIQYRREALLGWLSAVIVAAGWAATLLHPRLGLSPF